MTQKAYQDTPADAGLLRALAVDIEEDGSYVAGFFTASKLRALAERLDNPVVRAFLAVVDKMDAYRSKPATIEVRFVEHPSGEADVVMDLTDGVRLISDFGFVRTSENGATRGES